MHTLLKWFMTVFCCFMMVSPLAGGAVDSEGTLPISSDAVDVGVPVSPGLRNFAAATDMVVAVRIGELYDFSAEDFLRSLNLSELSYITVTSAPSAEEGTLFLGNSVVQTGQIISSGNLSRLTYSPASEEARVGSFTFSVNDSGYGLTCRIYNVSELGDPPTNAYAPESAVSAETHRNLSVTGRLSGYDPNGDALVFEIVSPPAHGAIRLLDRSTGSYLYTPYNGYTGEDSFCYVVRDARGRYSESREVLIEIAEPTVSVSFTDISDDMALNAALTMAENNIMSGTSVGGKIFFYPEKTVCRAEFLAMAMRAVGISEADASGMTVFTDDAEIPNTLRGYVKAAYEMGIVSGTFGKEGLCFEPNRAVTEAEAAKILSGLIGISERASESVKVPGDLAASAVLPSGVQGAPAWAEGAIRHLAALGIFPADGAYDTPSAALTREDVAAMLASLFRIMES